MKVTLLGNKYGIYIDTKTNNAHVNYIEATNFDDVNMDGVNHLVIRRYWNGEMRIKQANGYSVDRGLFTQDY